MSPCRDSAFKLSAADSVSYITCREDFLPAEMNLGNRTTQNTMTAQTRGSKNPAYPTNGDLLPNRDYLLYGLFDPRRDLVYKLELIRKRDYVQNGTVDAALHKGCAGHYLVSTQ